MINMVKLPTNKSSLFLRVAKGHFATSHSHINYYIDVTTQKSRLSEAKAVAKRAGGCLPAQHHRGYCPLPGRHTGHRHLPCQRADQGRFANMNAHQTIYVITPEYTTGSQIILRDNLAPMVKGKHVLILAASITTGYTVQAAIEAINYYGGTVAGLSAIFATATECLASRSPLFLTPPTCPITPASIPASAPCARQASISMHWSTASAIRRCKPPCPIRFIHFLQTQRPGCHRQPGLFLILLFSGTQTGRAGRPAQGMPP